MLESLKSKAKKISKDMILVNIGIIVLGLFLVIKPGEAEEIICRILGGIVAAWGGFKLFEYFVVRQKNNDMSVSPMIGGCILLAIGLSILIAPNILTGFIRAALALVLFLGALFKLQYALSFMQNSSKMWWVQTIGAVLMIITSVIAFINPIEQIIMVFIGFALMADGIWDLLSILYISKVLKKAVNEAENTPPDYSSSPSSSGRYIETTAEDVSSDNN